MKQKFLLIAALGIISLAATAQESKLPNVKNEIGLSPAQQETIKALRKTNAEKIKQLKEVHKKEVLATLTPEQQKKLQDLKTTKQAAAQEKKLAMLKNKLSLTDKQAADLKQHMAENKTAVLAIKNNSSLDATKRMEALKAHKEAQEKKLSAILTADQIEKIKKLKKHRKGKRHKIKRLNSAKSAL
jgi:hypothetical protein